MTTKRAGEPNHAGNSGGQSVWYTWSAPADGLATVSTLGSSFDTLLNVYTGPAVANLTVLATNDDAGPTEYTSLVSFPALAGTARYCELNKPLCFIGPYSVRDFPNCPLPCLTSISSRLSFHASLNSEELLGRSTRQQPAIKRSSCPYLPSSRSPPPPFNHVIHLPSCLKLVEIMSSGSSWQGSCGKANGA